MNLTLCGMLLCLGMFIGALSGLFGIGGGVVAIPALMYLFHFGYKQAVGTSLGMMLPPIGLFAVLAYWRAGELDIRAALLMACGFAAGALLSAWAVTHIALPEVYLRRAFAIALLYIAGNMLFQTDTRASSALRAAILSAGGAALFAGFRLLGKRWERKRAAELYRTATGRPVYHDYEI